MWHARCRGERKNLLGTPCIRVVLFDVVVGHSRCRRRVRSCFSLEPTDYFTRPESVTRRVTNSTRILFFFFSYFSLNIFIFFFSFPSRVFPNGTRSRGTPAAEGDDLLCLIGFFVQRDCIRRTVQGYADTLCTSRDRGVFPDGRPALE